jgi:hypothetical protein
VADALFLNGRKLGDHAQLPLSLACRDMREEDMGDGESERE